MSLTPGRRRSIRATGTGKAKLSVAESGSAHIPAFIGWAADTICSFNPEKRSAPRGWNEETTASSTTIWDEIRRRQLVARDEHDDHQLLAELCLLVVEDAPIARRAVWVEELKASPPQRKRGRAPHVTMLRDALIFQLVEVACRATGLRRFRNDATFSRPCGCSIVAAALERAGRPLDAKSVSGIYRRFRRRLQEANERRAYLEWENSRGK